MLLKLMVSLSTGHQILLFRSRPRHKQMLLGDLRAFIKAIRPKLSIRKQEMKNLVCIHQVTTFLLKSKLQEQRAKTKWAVEKFHK
jgi:hypothetical protein